MNSCVIVLFFFFFFFSYNNAITTNFPNQLPHHQKRPFFRFIINKRSEKAKDITMKSNKQRTFVKLYATEKRENEIELISFLS